MTNQVGDTVVTKETTAILRERENANAHRDPITDEPGAHMIGTGLGAAAGGVAGVAAGVAASAATGLATGTLFGGPVGGTIGLVAGALVGGLAGSALGELVNPTEEDRYWSVSYKNEPYYNSNYSFADYRPAYRTGFEGHGQHQGLAFQDVESHLEQDYIRNRGDSRLNWEQARPATLSAWNRMSSSGATKESVL